MSIHKGRIRRAIMKGLRRYRSNSKRGKHLKVKYHLIRKR